MLFNTYVYFHLHDFYSLFEYRAKGVSIVWFIRWFFSFIFITFQLFLLFFDAFKVCISIMDHNKSRQQFYKARRMWSKNEWKSNQALWGLGMKYRMRETARWNFNYFSLKKIHILSEDLNIGNFISGSSSISEFESESSKTD